MSDPTNVADSGPGAAFDPPPSAGAALRAAREAGGLTIDEIAQQLKLAPRQVQALENDDFAALPGRTFVRGFVRNYARYVGLEADDVVALLPGADVAPSLSRPTITPSSRPMGHLPADVPPRRSWTGWLIALVLVAIVAAAGVYEFRRPQGEARRAGSDKAASTAAPAAAVDTGNVTTSGGTTTATLPNPLGDAATPAPATVTAPDASTAAPLPSSTATSVPVPSNPPAASEPASTSAAAPPATAANDALLVLTFKGTSWAQVKDRNGNVLLAQTYPAGTTQAVNGAAPLDIVIGNATQVTATFRGQNVDLSPHVRGTVARLSVK